MIQIDIVQWKMGITDDYRHGVQQLPADNNTHGGSRCITGVRKPTTAACTLAWTDRPLPRLVTLRVELCARSLYGSILWDQSVPCHSMVGASL